MPTSKLYNTLLDGSGNPQVGVTVKARLHPIGAYRTSDNAGLTHEQSVVTNGAGYYEFTLEESSNITPEGSYYEIEEQLPASAGGAKFWACTIGAADSTVPAANLAILPTAGFSQFLTQQAGDARYAALGAVGAPPTVPYITLGQDPILNVERVLVPGVGIAFVDGGGGGNLEIRHAILAGAGLALAGATLKSILNLEALWVVGGCKVANNVMPPGIRVPHAANIDKFVARLGTAPTGAGLTFRVMLNGAQIATATFAAGTTLVEADINAVAVVAGDIITVDVTAIGSGVAGSDLSIALIGQ